MLYLVYVLVRSFFTIAPNNSCIYLISAPFPIRTCVVNASLSYVALLLLRRDTLLGEIKSSVLALHHI